MLERINAYCTTVGGTLGIHAHDGEIYSRSPLEVPILPKLIVIDPVRS